MAGNWWEVQDLPSVEERLAPKSSLARAPDFYAQQQAVDDELYRKEHANDSQSQRALNQSAAQLEATIPTVRGLYRTLTGDEARGQEDLRQAQHTMDLANEFAPDVQNIEDIRSVRDVGAYARNAVLSNLPTAVPTLAGAVLTGGLSAAAGGGLRALATKGLEEGVGKLASKALTYKTGQYLGALGASSALQTTQVLDAALDTSTGESARTRAAKAAVGAVTTGALDALPEVSVLNKIGLGGAAKRAIAPELTKALEKEIGHSLAKDVGKQALFEGTTEAIQSFGERLTHKWVNDNVEVIGPQAYSDYLNSFVAGGLVGGVLGGGPEVARAVRGKKATTNESNNPAEQARGRVRQAFDALIKRKDNAGPIPLNDSEQGPLQPKPGETVGELKATPKAKPEEVSTPPDKSPAETMVENTKALKSGKPLPGAIGALFGEHHAELEDADFNSDFDTLLSQYQEISQGGRAPSDANGIIGRTQNDGVVRGGVPYNGVSLFKADLAQSLWDTAKQTGKPISTFQAYALSALDGPAVEHLGKEPIKAAALYLSTADRGAVNEDHLSEYLNALPSPQAKIQFLFAADQISELVKKGREANGITETTPKDLRQMIGTKEEPLRSSVDVEDKTNFDLRNELSDNPDGNFQDFQEQQSMDEANLGPQPVSLNDTLKSDEIPFVKQHSSQRRGVIEVSNKNTGKTKSVSIAGLVAKGWKAAQVGVFNAKSVVDVVAQAVDVLQQRGYTVDPNVFKPGMWLGGDTTLTPSQAKAIRVGLQSTEAARPPVQETPGIPNVPAGERPYTGGEVGQDAEEVDTTTPDQKDRILRTRARSPLGLRLTPQGLNEGETIDTDAADNVQQDQNDNLSAAERAIDRASKAVGDTRPFKGGIDARLRELKKRAGDRPIPPKYKKDIQQALDRLEESNRSQQDVRHTQVDPQTGKKVTRVDRAESASATTIDPAQEVIDRQRQRDIEEENADANRLAAGVPSELKSKPVKVRITYTANDGTQSSSVVKKGSRAYKEALQHKQAGSRVKIEPAKSIVKPNEKVRITYTANDGTQSSSVVKKGSRAYKEALQHKQAGSRVKIEPAKSYADEDFSVTPGVDDDKTLREFVKRSKQVKAEEKDSDPTTWSPAIKKAMDDGDWRRFSRLRGYTQAQIDNFSRYLELADALIKKYGEDNVASVDFGIEQGLDSLDDVRLALTWQEHQFDEDFTFNVDDLLKDDGQLGDLAKEQSLLDALTKQLGIEPISLVPMPAGRTAFGLYIPGTRQIALSSKRQGSARLDTLLHELGHAVVLDTYEKLSPADKAAVHDEYQQWLREAKGAGTQLGARITRAPFFIRKDLLSKNPVDLSKKLSELSDQQLRDLFSWDEFLADHIARALSANAKTRGTISTFFHELAAKLRSLYELFAGDKYKPAPTVEKWVDSLLKGDMARAFNAQSIDRQNQIVYGDDPVGPTPPPTSQTNAQPNNSAPANLFWLLNRDDRKVLERFFRDPKVQQQIYDAADADQKKHLDLYGQDMVVLINLGAKMHLEGRLQYGAALQLNQLIEGARRLLGLPSKKDVVNQITADWAANQIIRGDYDGVKKAFDRNEYTKNTLAVLRGVRRVVQPVSDKFTVDVGTRLRQSENPALRKMATLFETRVGENAGEASFAAKRAEYATKWHTAYMNIIGETSEATKKAVNRALQENVAPTDPQQLALYNQMKGLYRNLFNWSNQNGVKIELRKDYYPIMMDQKAVKDHWNDIKAMLLAKPEYEADIRKFFKDNETDLPTLADRLVQISATGDDAHIGEVQFGLGVFAPSVSAQRPQIFGFLDAADRKAFSKYQISSLDAVSLRYIGQATKKAAFFHVFGTTSVDQYGNQVPNRLGRLRQQARRFGANEHDIKLFDQAAQMMLGSYKAELNPAIGWVFSQVDKVFDSDLKNMSIEQWGHYQAVAMTYENLRVLPLAALSSLIDSLGTIARGGNLVDATKSIWDGMKAMRKDGNDLSALGLQLGVIEKYALSDALAATYGGTFDPSGKVGKINNALFKWNGLEAITKHSRLAALAMGHRFLLRHAENPGKHSARLLKELQLEPGDIVRDPANPNFVRRNRKVDEALRRFVNEAVVRPQPLQRPGWHNDPNFRFAAQYKGYLYAFYTTIVGRMIHEADRGNYVHALAPLAPYLAVTVAAEMIRYAVQHPGDDDPRDPDDYMRLAMIRSGLVGPRFGLLNDAKTDTRYGSWITNSWTGPAGQQAGDLVDVATGKRSFGRTAVEALPFSALYEDWQLAPDSSTSNSPTAKAVVSTGTTVAKDIL